MDYAWSTHQPLIKAVLKSYNPAFILELGIGNYSTPFFMAHEGEKMFIENDKVWIDKMGINAICHEIPITSQDVPVHNVSPEVKQSIIDYYQYLKGKLLLKTHPSLLFVDNYSCCRALAINILYPVFDIIIYHDSEPQSIHRNNYYFTESIIQGFDHYDLQTPRTWASVFIRKELKKDMNIQPFIEEYEKENNVSGIILK